MRDNIRAGVYTHLATDKNRHHNFTPTLGVAGNMSRKLQHVRHDDSLLGRGGGAAHALPEADLLASGLALERAQQQELVVGRRVCSRDSHAAGASAFADRGRGDGRGKDWELVVADVEAGPVDGGGRGGEGGVGVPEEGGDVGEVARESQWLGRVGGLGIALTPLLGVEAHLTCGRTVSTPLASASTCVHSPNSVVHPEDPVFGGEAARRLRPWTGRS